MMDQEVLDVLTKQDREVLDVLCSAHSSGPSGLLLRQDAEYALKALHDAGYRVTKVRVGSGSGGVVGSGSGGGVASAAYVGNAD
jgi:hypothetical protein